MGYKKESRVFDIKLFGGENMNDIVKKENNPLMPQCFKEKLEMAAELAKSGLMPSSVKTAQQIVVSLQWGHELGLSPMVAINNIVVVNGRPTLSTDIMFALARNNTEYAGCQWKSQTSEKAEVIVKRKIKNGIEEQSVGYFDLDMARKAGLANKENWIKYPQRMLKHRALSYALRDAFPDVLSGIYTPEEMDSVNNAPIDITDIAEVKTSDPTLIFQEAFGRDEILQCHLDFALDHVNANSLNESLLQSMKYNRELYREWERAYKLGYIDEKELKAVYGVANSKLEKKVLDKLIQERGFDPSNFEKGISHEARLDNAPDDIEFDALEDEDLSADDDKIGGELWGEKGS